MSGGVVFTLVVLGVLVVAFGVVGGFGWGALVVMAELRPKGSTEGRLLRALAEMQTLHDAATRELVRRSVPPSTVPIDGSTSGEKTPMENSTLPEERSAGDEFPEVPPVAEDVTGEQNSTERLEAWLDRPVAVPPPGRPPSRRSYGPSPGRPRSVHPRPVAG